MTQERKTYTREFKLEATQLAETSGKPVAQIERELGCNSRGACCGESERPLISRPKSATLPLGNAQGAAQKRGLRYSPPYLNRFLNLHRLGVSYPDMPQGT